MAICHRPGPFYFFTRMTAESLVFLLESSALVSSTLYIRHWLCLDLPILFPLPSQSYLRQYSDPITPLPNILQCLTF